MSIPAHNPSAYLVDLARRLTQPYLASAEPRAILLVGSPALGVSDYFSDLDMSFYYDTLPDEALLDAARQHNQGSERLWTIGDRAEGAFIESYSVNGIECQLIHSTIAAWEQQQAVVLEQLDVTTPLHKAMEGLLYGMPLYGAELIAQWKERAAQFPPALAQAMVEHYLKIVPLWYFHDRFASRDATLWYHQIMLEAAQNILGVLAGLNHRYYSTFQFKRMQKFIAQLPLTPPDLATRIELLFAADRPTAIQQLEALTSETVALVEQHMPQVDTSRLRQRLGQRQAAWQPAPLPA